MENTGDGYKKSNLIILERRGEKTMKKYAFLFGFLLIPQLAQGEMFISKPYNGPRLGNVQALIRNNSNRDIFIMPQWIERNNIGTVEPSPGYELKSSECFNLTSRDSRASRLVVFFDGHGISPNPSSRSHDLSVIFASGTNRR